MASFTNAVEKTLGSTLQADTSGMFSATLSKPGKNGEQYENIVVNDQRVPWRFKTLHPMAVALILDHAEEAAKALNALPGLRKRKAQQAK